MPCQYQLMLFYTRLPHLTHKQFRERYETRHVPLIAKLAATVPEEKRPIRYSRVYLQHEDSDPHAEARNPGVNGEVNIPFDVVVNVVFSERQHAVEAEEVLYRTTRLFEDEAKQFDMTRSRSYVVEEVVSEKPWSED